MARIAKARTDELDLIRSDVKESYEYFKKNIERYHKFRKFLFDTTLSSDDITMLQTLSKPQLEFNILEAYISRLRGEFSRMEPGFTVKSSDSAKEVDPRMIDVIEAHLKAMFLDSNNDSLFYDLYTDLLSGGYSVAEVYTDYRNEMSFEQDIYCGRVFDPTLCGFDPLARLSHKGDGRYAFQTFPKTKESAIDEFGYDIVKDAKFTRNFEGFEWSYINETTEIIIICDYYKREFKEKKIIRLRNGRVMTVDDYEQFVALWQASGYVEVPPAPVGKARKTQIEHIYRYRVTGTKVLDVIETNYKYLPLVFFDGNSAMLRDSSAQVSTQMTRPYIYQARDVQKLKNFAGQTLANELENMIMHKWKAPVEGIPEDYKDAYINPQIASVVLYNAFKDNNPDVPLPPPMEVSRIPTPPEVTGTFSLADQMTQTILGSYDSALGINNNELSGVAIMQGAMHSNAAAQPYNMGFIKGLNRVAQIVIDLIPKYYVTPRTIPIVDRDGKRAYIKINDKKDPNGVKINYDARNLEVKVEAGVNFEVQKQMSLDTIVKLMGVSETFAQFMNQDGLQVLLDNIDIRGIDNLKQMAEQYQVQVKQQMQQQQAMAQQQAMNQVDPSQLAQMQMQIEQQKIQQKAQEAQMKTEADIKMAAGSDALKQQELDIKFMEIMGKLQQGKLDSAIDHERVSAENARTSVEMLISTSKHHEELKHGRQEELDRRSDI